MGVDSARQFPPETRKYFLVTLLVTLVHRFLNRRSSRSTATCNHMAVVHVLLYAIYVPAVVLLYVCMHDDTQCDRLPTETDRNDPVS